MFVRYDVTLRARSRVPNLLDTAVSSSAIYQRRTCSPATLSELCGGTGFQQSVVRSKNQAAVVIARQMQMNAIQMNAQPHPGHRASSYLLQAFALALKLSSSSQQLDRSLTTASAEHQGRGMDPPSLCHINRQHCGPHDCARAATCHDDAQQVQGVLQPTRMLLQVLRRGHLPEHLITQASRKRMDDKL